MNRSHRLAIVLLLSVLVSLSGAAGLVDAQTAGPVSSPADPLVVRIYYAEVEDIRLLVDYDVFEFNERKEKYFLAAVDEADLQQIRQMGFRVEIDPAETAQFNQGLAALRGQQIPEPGRAAYDKGIPGFPCYRTVEETFAAAQDIVANHPNLAAWSDVGDSWEKTQGLGGYDMMVLKLTNAIIGGDKPKLFITTSIHARELTPAELATRFAEYLIDNYGLDADVTWLLDYHEIHLLLQANPDGRKQAETGLSWRKNTNRNYCSPTSNSRGADLNRNFVFQWGCCGGSSGNQCSDTYRGPSPASEPETQAIQDYLRAIFPDRRADPLNAPAPDDASGIYLDIHSYSELVLWPWGFTASPAPNGPQLQTLGRKLAFFNGYEPDQSVGLYPTDGTTDDFGYGELGVASYTFELGTTFFQSCSIFESTILPDNLESLIYAAKVLRRPYLTPAGPDALNVAVSAARGGRSTAAVTAGTVVELTAVIDDTRFSSRNGTEPRQNIAAAEYTIDTPPWDAVKVQAGAAMSPLDGNFDSTIEAVEATLDTAGLSEGRHIIFVRGQDTSGNWGAVSAVFLDVAAPPEPDFTLGASPASQAICLPGAAIFDVSLAALAGFADPVTLSASGQPAGAAASFAPNPLTPPGSSLLTIEASGAAPAGSYAVEISGVSPTATTFAPLSTRHTSTVQLDLVAAAPGAVSLLAPGNGAMGVSTTPVFSWAGQASADSYALEVARDADFKSMVISTTLGNTSYTATVALNTDSLYFWRVRADNACGSALSAVASFITQGPPGQCGLGLAPELVFVDGLEGGAAGWTHGGTDDTWRLSSTRVHSGSFAFHAANSSTVSDQRLVSPAIDLPSRPTPLTLHYWNYQEIESSAGGCFDGGILEISADNGATWTQLDAELLSDPYDGVVDDSHSNPLGGLNAWCGDPADWTLSIVDISAYAGQTVHFRFRLGSDSSLGREGWTVDDVLVQACAAPTGVKLSELEAGQVAAGGPAGPPMAGVLAVVLAALLVVAIRRPALRQQAG